MGLSAWRWKKVHEAEQTEKSSEGIFISSIVYSSKTNSPRTCPADDLVNLLSKFS